MLPNFKITIILSFTTSVLGTYFVLGTCATTLSFPCSEVDVNAKVSQETTISILSQNGNTIGFYGWLFCIQIYILGARF